MCLPGCGAFQQNISPIRHRIFVRISRIIYAPVGNFIFRICLVPSTVWIIVIACFIYHFHVTLGSYIGRQLSRYFPPVLKVVTQSHITALGTFGRDDNYTGCGTWTVDRSRSSILQYGHTFYVFRIYGVDITRNSVNNHQRTGITNSCYTTYLDRSTTTGSSIVTTDHYSGKRALQSCGKLGGTTGSKFVSFNSCYRTGEIFLLHRTIPHYDYLIQLRIVFL